MRVLLLTPPMVQWNTPYPATAYLAGFLKLHASRLKMEVFQRDLSIELACKLFSAEGLQRVRAALAEKLESSPVESDSVRFFLEACPDYIGAVDPVVRFLQGKDPSVALRLAARKLVPEGPRFVPLGEQAVEAHLQKMFGELGVQDRAKYIGSLFIDDLADVVAHGIDERFGLARYAERLAASQASFDAMHAALSEKPTLVGDMIAELAATAHEEARPHWVCISAPFPGNVYGAFLIARALKRLNPDVKTILGGGYPNTELRRLSDPRVFDDFDYVTLDDGERPLLNLLEGKRLKRTFLREKGVVRYEDDSADHDVPHAQAGTPTYEGLDLTKYISLIEMLNPMHRIWSDARWNKLTVAHGCYWKKCAFCDTSLNYIGRYENAPARILVDRMEALIAQTGQSGFHLVDEAAPPAALRAVSEEILKRRLAATWWGNIRFEKAFTPELAMLMSDAGCVAVTGGLEVASNRLLKLMNKGVTVEQVARVTKGFADAGIFVHAYLMYGFPTQTLQETAESLEMVRQLFKNGCLQSAYWHRFSATVHSDIGKNPAKYGIRLLPRPFQGFAENDLPFEDPTGVDHDVLGRALRRALYNYMHGLCLDEDVRAWFADEGISRVGRVSVPANYISRALSNPVHQINCHQTGARL